MSDTAILDPAPQTPAPPTVGGLVYVLHFTRPYRHAKHLIGATTRDESDHLYGATTALLQALRHDGGDIVIADIFDTETLAQATELAAKLRRQGSRARVCSICNPGNGRGLGRGNNRNGCRKRPVD